MSKIKDLNFLDYAGLSQYTELEHEYVKKEIGSEKTRATAAELAIVNSLAQLETQLNGQFTTVNSKIDANTSAIELLNADSNTEGSVDYKVKQEVNSVIGGASEAYDTLKELEDLLKNSDGDIAEIISNLATLVTKVEANESAIEENTTAISDLDDKLDNSIVSLKSYVDLKDKEWYDRIGSIEDSYIGLLFKEKVNISDGQTVQNALANLQDGQMLVLKKDSAISENVNVPSGAVIDANGATFSGNVTVSDDAIIQNAIFTGKVTVG